MSHDFGSIGSQNRRSGSQSGAASGGGSGPGIGFHELRQALEISTLREDLERLTHGADALRGHVEDAVEQVRDRFAALSAEEMADAAAMAPLLQFAVAALLDVREQVRRLDTRTGAVGDEDRPSWQGVIDSQRPRPPHAAPVAAAPTEVEDAPPPPRRDPAPSPVMTTTPAPSAPMSWPRDVPSSEPPPRGAARPALAPSTSASWLTSESPVPPSPSRAAATRGGGGVAAPPPGGIDWLGRAGR